MKTREQQQKQASMYIKKNHRKNKRKKQIKLKWKYVKMRKLMR